MHNGLCMHVCVFVLYTLCILILSINIIIDHLTNKQIYYLKEI